MGFADDAYLAEGILFLDKRHSEVLSTTNQNSYTVIT